MKVNRIRKSSLQEQFTGILYPDDATAEEAANFLDGETVSIIQLINFVTTPTWFIKDSTDNLYILSATKFNDDGWYINIQDIYWEIYEVTPINGNSPELILRGTVQEEDLGNSGVGEITSILMNQDWYNRLSYYLLRRSDGYITTINSMEVYL